MNQDIQGVNTLKLDELKSSVYESAEEVLRTLKTIDKTLEDSNEYLSDDLSASLKIKYEELSANYYKIYQNLISISNEFDRVNYKYREQDDAVARSTAKKDI